MRCLRPKWQEVGCSTVVGFRQGRCPPPPPASFLLGATSSGFCAPGGQGHPSFSPGPGAMPAHSRQILTHYTAMQKAMFPGLRCLGCRSLGRVQGHGCRAERRPLHGHSPCHITCSAGVRSTYSRSSWNLPHARHIHSTPTASKVLTPASTLRLI